MRKFLCVLFLLVGVAFGPALVTSQEKCCPDNQIKNLVNKLNKADPKDRSDILANTLIKGQFVSTVQEKEKKPPQKHGRGCKAPDPVKLAKLKNLSHARHHFRLKALPRVTMPTFDLRALGTVPPIVDQGQCMPPGTMVQMERGDWQPIEKIKSGDYVVTGEGNYAEVVQQFYKAFIGKLVRIKLVGGLYLEMTKDHLIYTPRGYVKGGELTTDDSVCVRWNAGDAHAYEKIKSITSTSYKGLVYDLRVAVDRSYVANGFCVHNCGSCWDFSGTGMVSSAYMAAMGAAWPGPFSEQYTLDCGSNGGCNGDDNTTVLIWAKSTGLPTTADYGPYQGQAGQCKSGVKLYKINDWGFCDGTGNGVTDTQKIKDAMVAYRSGIGCAVAAGGTDFWNTGQGTDVGNSSSIDHDVILVGWDDTHDNGDGSKGAWIMRNSWSTTWGATCANSANPNPKEAGYAWVKYGADQLGTEAVFCTVTPLPVTPVLVPNLIGDGLADATSALTKTGLVVGTVTGNTSGTVTATSPAVGATVQPGTAVNLTFGGTPPNPGTVTITIQNDTAADLLQALGGSSGKGVFITPEMTVQQMSDAIQKCLEMRKGKNSEPPLAKGINLWQLEIAVTKLVTDYNNNVPVDTIQADFMAILVALGVQQPKAMLEKMAKGK
jgi:Papain family cysteine protease/PASTA domain